jgi:uncharacterized protein
MQFPSVPSNDEVPARRESPLEAGRFSVWFRAIRSSLNKRSAMKVPCGTCDACCRSSRFVHVGRSEKRSLEHIPHRLLFPAPFLPEGTMVLGYDQMGRCPMLSDDGCSIYTHRPMTCRSFDCRILAACEIGLEAENPIARQARRWRFQHPSKRDQRLIAATRSAARFLKDHAKDFPIDTVSGDEVQVAATAIRISGIFLTRRGSDRHSLRRTMNAVRAALGKK